MADPLDMDAERARWAAFDRRDQRWAAAERTVAAACVVLAMALVAALVLP